MSLITMGFDMRALESHLSTIQKLGRGTITTRRSRIRIFLNWLEDQELSPQTTQAFFLYLKEEKKLSNTSLNTYLVALVSLKKYLKFIGYKQNFLRGFTRYVEEEPNIIPLSNEEVRILRSACLQPAKNPYQQTQQDMVIFITDTGARYEDVQIFKCSSVDIPGQQITYRQLKTGSMRILPIAEPLLSILKRRITGKHSGSLVFPNKVGHVMHYPDYHKYLKNKAKEEGISKRTSPHILRHSYGQNSYDQTGDIYLTKDLIGHKNIKSTMRYAKNSTERLKTAQYSHPHLDLAPEIIIEQLQKDLERRKLQRNKKFNNLKVIKAINNFISELYESISIV